VLTLGFIFLLAAGAWIAWRSWQEDPAQRTPEHLWTWVMRTMIGRMWYQGSLWKLPLPVSGGLSYWLTELSNNAAVAVHGGIAKNIMIPALPLLNPIVYLTELGLAISFMLGILVRPMAAVGILFTLHLWLGLYRHTHEWPWLYIFLVFVQAYFIMHHAGRSLGLDAMMTKRPWGPLKGDGAIASLYRRFG
jgi:uncharacterized membrane protein YphA (DoxX/SURF4 family)